MHRIPHGGICIVVRKFALAKQEVDAEGFQQITRYLELSGEDDYIAVYGPLKGGEASMDVQREFERLGLSYLEDFYALDLFLPSWLSAALAFRPQ